MNLFCRAISRKSILIVCFTVFSTVLFSQERPVSLSVKGGFSLNSFGNDNRAGGRMGVAAEIPCSNKVSIQPALFFSAKGGVSHSSWSITKTSYGSTEQQTTVTDKRWASTANYLEMPVEVLFHIPFHKQGRGLQLSVGPYFAAAVGGKTIYTKKVDCIQTEKHTYDTFGKDGMDFKKYDIGVTYEIHFELGHFLIGNYFEFGSIPLSGNTVLHYAFGQRNVSAGVDFGYRF